mmetsp:Transcript_109185/g.170742  ORF Transcript_109185/g.170742 Transcript_109185/m.170742 type:complete len:231 (+) Transcript_109185:44-736(+)
MLNKVTFNATVTQEHVDQWVVLFCVDWWDRCQGLVEYYKALAMHWEHELAGAASSWQSTAVRFGEVNCATDKPLCNENNVQEYPTAHFFFKGQLASQWVPSSSSASLSDDISRWITQELTKTRRPSSQRQSANADSLFVDAASMWTFGMRELSTLLSWRNPITASFGFIVLACVIAVLAYTIATGLEVTLMAPVLGFIKGAKNKATPCSLLRALPEFPEPRTIVRESLEL